MALYPAMCLDMLNWMSYSRDHTYSRQTVRISHRYINPESFITAWIRTTETLVTFRVALRFWDLLSSSPIPWCWRLSPLGAGYLGFLLREEKYFKILMTFDLQPYQNWENLKFCSDWVRFRSVLKVEFLDYTLVSTRVVEKWQLCTMTRKWFPLNDQLKVCFLFIHWSSNLYKWLIFVRPKGKDSLGW